MRPQDALPSMPRIQWVAFNQPFLFFELMNGPRTQLCLLKSWFST
jgi:hypothetical protein